MKTPRSPSLSAEAFSLVEVVVALGIFAFSILTIIGLMGSSLKLTRDNEERIQAANVATILMTRYQELLKTNASSETTVTFPQGFPSAMPTSADNLQQTGSFSPSVEWIDSFGNEVSSKEEAAFGMTHLVTGQPVGSNTTANIVRCSLQLHWPAVAAEKEDVRNTYTATTAFVVAP